MSIQFLIDSIKDKGLQVYGPEKLTTYVFFTDGARVGYAQYDRLEGVKYSTVHKANKYNGTGFSAKSAEEALAYAPSWAGQGYLGSVVKYRDFDEFKTKYWQPLVQY